jgi:hypothetical protein
VVQGDSFLSTLSRSTLLREADVLTVLDLSENDIGDNGAAALAATLAAAGGITLSRCSTQHETCYHPCRGGQCTGLLGITYSRQSLSASISVPWPHSTSDADSGWLVLLCYGCCRPAVPHEAAGPIFQQAG